MSIFKLEKNIVLYNVIKSIQSILDLQFLGNTNMCFKQQHLPAILKDAYDMYSFNSKMDADNSAEKHYGTAFKLLSSGNLKPPARRFEYTLR
jgi:hypothetical protein